MPAPLPKIDRARKKELRRLEKNLGVRFRKIERLQWALQHRSYVNENPELKLSHNERLEFLGDSVLGFIVAHLLCEKFPQFSEGKLTLLKSSLVNKDRLAWLSEESGVGEFLILGRGEARGGGRKRASILADAFEAVIAAFYLDRGIKPTFKFLTRIFGKLIEESGPKELQTANPKNLLQKLSQGRFGLLPEYRIEEESGPQHRKTFTVSVWVDGKECGRGEGATKKKAEEAAAQVGFKALKNAT